MPWVLLAWKWKWKLYNLQFWTVKATLWNVPMIAECTGDTESRRGTDVCKMIFLTTWHTWGAFFYFSRMKKSRYARPVMFRRLSWFGNTGVLPLEGGECKQKFLKPFTQSYSFMRGNIQPIYLFVSRTFFYFIPYKMGFGCSSLMSYRCFVSILNISSRFQARHQHVQSTCTWEL